jgi:hypothetical protein
MAKTYSTPTVAALGPAELHTYGLMRGTLFEPGFNPFLRTTHAMVDL